MRNAKLAMELSLLLLAGLVFATCGPVEEPTARPMPEATAKPGEPEEVPVAKAEPPLPWEEPYEEAPPDLCPPDIVCQGQMDFADPVPEIYEGKEVWVQRGRFTNAQGEEFGMDVTSPTSETVRLYADNVRVCLDQVFTGEATVGIPSEPGLDLLPKDFGTNPEDVSTTIYLLGPAENKQDYVVDFVIDPTVGIRGVHHYPHTLGTKAYVEVSVAAGGGAVGAELILEGASVWNRSVWEGGTESEAVSLDNGEKEAVWELEVRGEESGTYRVSGRKGVPANWNREYELPPPCAEEDICLKLAPGQSIVYPISYTTELRPVTKLDVLLLFDASASMSREIASVRANASWIMDAVREKVPDAAFGVASFTDYPGRYECDGYATDYGTGPDDDYPWEENQDITSDKDAVQQGLDSLQISPTREDFAESYTRALSETTSVSWRPGAKKVVVLFGDAVPHDTGFFLDDFGRNFGVDPGRDEEACTDDDLDYEEVVQTLHEQRIEVIALNSAPESDGELYSMAAKSLGYVAEKTGGQMRDLDDAAEVPEDVVSSLEATIAQTSWLDAVPEYLPSGPVASAEPRGYQGVGGGEICPFEVTITVPESTLPGTYEFDVTVRGDGLPRKVFHVQVYVQ